MSKIFDFIDTIVSLFQWFINFIKQMFSIVTQALPIIYDLLSTAVVHAPVLSYFFFLFLGTSVILFIWRLIP